MSQHPFPQTRWTQVLYGAASDPEAPHQALEHLARVYWFPIYTYLRGRGHTHEQAQDETQGFFAYLLGRDFLQNLKPEGGRFRNFLLVALRRWLKDERNRVINVKRDAETPLEPWHELDPSQPNTFPATTSPEEAFDRAWAKTLVTRCMDKLQDQWAKRAELFDELRWTVESPGDVEKYARIAGRLGMTEGAVGKAAHDLRRQFAECIRGEVRDSVARDDDIEAELRYLVRLMQAPSS